MANAKPKRIKSKSVTVHPCELTDRVNAVAGKLRMTRTEVARIAFQAALPADAGWPAQKRDQWTEDSSVAKQKLAIGA